MEVYVTLIIVQNTVVLIKKFCSDCRLRNMSDETIRGYRSNLRIFTEYVTNTNANVIDVDNQVLKGSLNTSRMCDV